MRLQKVRALLDQPKLDALLISQGDNRRYVSGFTGSSGWLLVTPHHALLMTDSRYWEQAASQCPDWELIRVTGKSSVALSEQLKRLDVARLGFESQNLTVDAFEQLREACGPDVEWVPTRSLVEKLREVKDAGELEALRRAIALTDEAFTWMAARLQPGMTERAVAWDLEKYMRERGASHMSFDVIVASGPNAALPHARPSDREIRAGEPITIDMGAVVDGYHADLTRTVCIGEPDEQFMKIFNTVLEAQLAAENGMEAGITGKEADALAREVIAAAGHDEHFGHSLGHGVGLVTHEGPTLSPRTEEDRVPQGATVTVEPGIYVPGWGGVRIEDIVWFGPNGVEVLTQASKEPRINVIA